MGGIYYLGKGGMPEGDTDLDNSQAGAEGLILVVWQRSARVVRGCLSWGRVINYYSRYFQTLKG